MNRISRLIGVVLTTSACAGAQGLPSAYRGDWNHTLEGCADRESFDGISITRDQVQFYEAGGEVTAVSTSNDGGVEAAFTWTDVNVDGPDGLPLSLEKAIRLSLSDGGSHLTMQMDDIVWTAVRCR